MRDPNRIASLLQELEYLWQQNPDMRFGQLVSNIYNKLDLWNAEDEVVIKTIDDILRNGWKVIST